MVSYLLGGDKRLAHAFLVIAGMVFFGLCSGNRLAALALLLATGVIVYIASSAHPDPARLFGLVTGRPLMPAWLLAGLLAGLALSVYCRYYTGFDIIPQKLRLTAIIAPLIGITEELVYRGLVQGLLSHRNRTIAIITASAGHSAYKVALLTTSTVSGTFPPLTLALFTFFTGCLFGYFRLRSGTIYPAVAGHAFFDLIVYGDQPVPDWVW